MAKFSRLVETTVCPKCGAKKKQYCIGKNGKTAKNAHAERHAVMVGKKASKNMNINITIRVAN